MANGIDTDWRKLFTGPTQPNYLQEELTPEEVSLLEQGILGISPETEEFDPFATPQGMGDSLLARSSVPVVEPLPAVGMAESLPQRSGDDLIKPTPTLETLKPTRSPASTKPAVPVQAIAPEGPDEFEQAQSERDRLMGLMMMARGSEKIGTSIAGVQSDKDFLKELLPIAENKVKDLKVKQEYQAGKMDLQQAKDATDPNSRISQIARDMAKKFVPDFNVEGASAQQLKAYLPTLVNAAEAQAAREARLEAARIAAEVKKEQKEKDRDDKKFTQEQKLADRIVKADEDTGYSAGRAALRSIREAQKTGKWDSTMDIETLYRFIKLLDPGSVVREGEIALTAKGESVIGTITKVPGKVTKGDILSNEFRKKMIGAIERNYRNVQQSFNERISPLRKQAQDYELDIDRIVDRNVLYGVDTVPGQNTVTVREKSSGRVKKLTPENASKVLQNPDYEKVQ